MKNKSESAGFLTDMLEKIDELTFVNQKNALALLVAMHMAGVIGLSIESTREIFQLLTPFNLVATAAIVLHFEEFKNKTYFGFIFMCFAIGFGVEVAGVATGIIFGEYSYGPTLGYKLFDVPLLIGVNWIVLSYCTRMAAQRFLTQPLLIALLASAMMVVLDFFIEPVAIKYDFWAWSNESIPLQNYFAWFITSFIIQLIGFKIAPNLNNQLAIKLLVVEVLFFVALNFI